MSIMYIVEKLGPEVGLVFIAVILIPIARFINKRKK